MKSSKDIFSLIEYLYISHYFCEENHVIGYFVNMEVRSMGHSTLNQDMLNVEVIFLLLWIR